MMNLTVVTKLENEMYEFYLNEKGNVEFYIECKLMDEIKDLGEVTVVNFKSTIEKLLKCWELDYIFI